MLTLTYFSPKVEKRMSAIHGRGLYAKAALAKGEIAVVKGGYVLTKAQRDAIGKELGPSEIQISEELFIGPSTAAEREGGMMHLNHSCEPNLGMQGQIVYVALRDISQDEELTLDYAMMDDEPYEYAMPVRGAELPRHDHGLRLAQARNTEEIRRLFLVVHSAPHRCGEAALTTSRPCS